MPKMLPKLNERECPACKGTGFQPVKQPKAPGRRIYPPRCGRCDGKGRITEPN
jgi:DnaJ-class molecular chaperone